MEAKEMELPDQVNMWTTSLVPRLSLHVNEKSNDGKLGGAWERGYVATITSQFVKCQFLIRGFP